jgi:phage gp16-like protein
MTISRRQIALLKVAVKQLGLTDAMYRSALAQIGGVTSSTELDREGFEAMLGFFEYGGFRPMDAKGPDYGAREGMASFAQLELIRNLWAEIMRHAFTGQTELTKWLLAKFKVSALRFVTKDTGRKVITALLAWQKRLREQAKPKAA